MSNLFAENISVRLGGAQILKEASIDLPAGKLVGLIGPNGAGKSTAVKAILGFVAVQQGRFRLDETDLAELPLQERAKKIAYMAQGAPVHWPLTVERTVELGRTPHMNPWQSISVKDATAVAASMKKADCIHLRDRLVTTLSGGERARVLLARTLAVGAGYILADEPIASLDPAHQLQVMECLKAEAKSGVGVMVVLHDLGYALRYCDKLILLYEGSVLAEGSPAEVLSPENLKRAFGVEVARWDDGATQYLVPHKMTQ
ncbi:MAG: ABC transporter [Kordiimonadales bacterium]|nr:MAG: ABC transporter [Kordiimonadales bacterium]